MLCECSRDDCRVLAEVRLTDEGFTLRFDQPADHFVLTEGTIRLISKDLR